MLNLNGTIDQCFIAECASVWSRVEGEDGHVLIGGWSCVGGGWLCFEIGIDV